MSYKRKIVCFCSFFLFSQLASMIELTFYDSISLLLETSMQISLESFFFLQELGIILFVTFVFLIFLEKCFTSGILKKLSHFFPWEPIASASLENFGFLILLVVYFDLSAVSCQILFCSFRWSSLLRDTFQLRRSRNQSFKWEFSC